MSIDKYGSIDKVMKAHKSIEIGTSDDQGGLDGWMCGIKMEDKDKVQQNLLL